MIKMNKILIVALVFFFLTGCRTVTSVFILNTAGQIIKVAEVYSDGQSAVSYKSEDVEITVNTKRAGWMERNIVAPIIAPIANTTPQATIGE